MKYKVVMHYPDGTEEEDDDCDFEVIEVED